MDIMSSKPNWIQIIFHIAINDEPRYLTMGCMDPLCGLVIEEDISQGSTKVHAVFRKVLH